MFIITGLGNFGKEYEKTRHNAGFMLIDQIQKECAFPDFIFEKKFQAEISRGKIANRDILLVKPQLFMNRSGEPIRSILDFFKLPSSSLLVAHDDLDIDLGKWKLTKNSGSGGHNGVQDIIEKIGSPDFWRIKIGIEGETRRKERLIPGEKFVLQKFSEEEKVFFENSLPEVILEIETKIKTSAL